MIIYKKYVESEELNLSYFDKYRLYIEINKKIKIRSINRGYDSCESSPPLKSTKKVLAKSQYLFILYNKFKFITIFLK